MNIIGIYYELGPKVRELLSRYKAINIDGCDKPYNVYHRDNELIKAFTDYYHHVNLIIDTEAAKDVLLNSNTISSYINLSIIVLIYFLETK